MVSNIRYHSFKHINVKDRVSFVAVIAVVLIFVLISLDPPQVLFMIFLAYAVSGPLFASLRLYQRRGSKSRAQDSRRL
jgi:CDP-diacylglycerol--serine O-phosphatidyltransferase